MNKQRGITLIALVVTIIVLIILAGITINLILGDNGIITKAQEAKEITRAANVQEQRDLWKINQEADKYSSEATAESLQVLVNRLEKEGLLTSDEKDQIIGNEEKGIAATGKVTIADRTIVFGSEAKTLVQAFKDGDITVGSYLDYKPIEGGKLELDTNKTGYSEKQTYTVDTTTTWRVLGLNEDETELLIISGSPVRRNGDDPYLHLAGQESYLYCVENLDNISKLYHNSTYASETRSITMDDITRLLGITVDKENNKAYKTNDPTKTELDGYWGFFGDSYIYKEGDKSPNNSIQVGETLNANSYVLEYTYSSIVDPTSTIYELLFKDTSYEEGNSKSYWLASPGTSAGSYVEFGPGYVHGYARQGVRMFMKSGTSFEGHMGVRPIISINKNVTIEDIKLTTGQESNWNTSAEHIAEL